MSGVNDTVANRSITLPITHSDTNYAYFLCPVGSKLGSGEMVWNRLGITKYIGSVTFQNLIKEGMYIITIGY